MVLIAAVLIALIAAPAAGAEERTLATKQDQINLHAYRGVAIFSLWNGSAYNLVASTGGGAPQPLNVPPQRFAFDADIGRRAGKPMVILHRSCKPSCGLELLALDGTPPQPTRSRCRAGRSTRRSGMARSPGSITAGFARRRARSRG